jgi:hypothetical protein
MIVSRRSVRGAGEIAEVGYERLVFEFDGALAFDGVVGMEDLVGDVGEDGGAARGDAAFGDEGEEACEELADVVGGVEWGELGEEVGGEVFGVVEGVCGNDFRDAVLGMAEAEAEVGGQTGEAAALAVGIDEGAARGIDFRKCGNGNDGGDRAIECGVHGFFLF